MTNLDSIVSAVFTLLDTNKPTDKQSNDCMVDWLHGWLLYMIDWLHGWLITWLIDYMVDWLHGWLITWLIDYMVDWYHDWLITESCFTQNT